MVEIFENISTYIKHRDTETSGRKKGMEKKFVLFQCSNDCQNDVILCSVKIPFFLTSRLLWKPGVNFRYTLTYFKVFVCLSGITVLHNFHFCDLAKITFVFLLLKAGLLTRTRNPFKSYYRNSRLICQIPTNVTSPKGKQWNRMDWWWWYSVIPHESIGDSWFTPDKGLVSSAFAAFLLFPCLFCFAFL